MTPRHDTAFMHRGEVYIYLDHPSARGRGWCVAGPAGAWRGRAQTLHPLRQAVVQAIWESFEWPGDRVEPLVEQRDGAAAG